MHRFAPISLSGGAAVSALALLVLTASIPARAVELAGVTPDDVIWTTWCFQADISPDGTEVAFVTSRQRDAEEEPGGRYSELYVVATRGGRARPYVTGKVNVSSPRWSPDGGAIAFLMARGKDAKRQVWVIPAYGGEATQVTHSETNVLAFRWHPSGKRIAYVAETPDSGRERKLKEKGYGFVFFEENLKHRNLYIVDLAQGENPKAEQLTRDVTVWDFEFSPDGSLIAAAISPENLVDQRYMFKRIYLLDLSTKRLQRLTDNPGKLGNFCFSPDGGRLAYAAAKERKDHAVSQAYVVSVSGGEPLNITPRGFRGHVTWVGWKDDGTVLYYAEEGVWPNLYLFDLKKGRRKTILRGEDVGLVFRRPRYTRDFKHFALICSSPEEPSNVYHWKPGKKPVRLTDLNLWVSARRLGRQEVIRYKARDGTPIEGILIYPVGYVAGTRHPVAVIVHGGPEAHYSNGWLTSYSRPGQVLAGRGYAVFYPNYRSSTGYGLEFASAGYNDAAGVEFDDIADGIKYLIDEGIADPERVGLTGGSYGGYAAAWFSSYYTKLVKAVVMFVGISDLISKRGTTDIPYEELYVHSGRKLEEMWQKSLERSPIYWAHQSRTAVLIVGGTDDTRVHPSQSLEYYRRLKMNGHPAVRLVQYPGEHHGNRMQTSQIDLIHRLLQWFDWYVRDGKPLDGPMPPLDISDSYGIDLGD